MPLLDATKWVLTEVERRTGKPVHVQEDASLSAIATVNMARGEMPVHIVRYKQIGNMPPDYWICWQCGFVLRLYELPASERFDCGPSDDGKKEIAQLLAQSPAAEDLRSMGEFFLSNLVTQLRSSPVGMRNDQWIAESLPELRSQQVAGVRKQLGDNLQGLNIPHRAVIPKKIFDANASMNAAFAIFWAEQLREPALVVPYRLAGFEAQGKRLMEILDAHDDGPESDRAIIDAWALTLGLQNWYRWIPHV